MPLGRNIDEAIRMIEALKYYKKHGEVCPANWRIGDQAIQENQESISRYLAN